VTRLRRIESGAERVKVGGVSVLVTSDTGPLTFGFVHPQILLPKWFVELELAGQQLVIAHEREHVRRADPALLVFCAITTAAVPWNPD